MLHLFHIGFIVVLMCADPFDPYNALFEIDGNDQSIIIPLNVEYDSVRRDDAGGHMAAPYIGCTSPPRFLDFIEPSIQGAF
jgi:hypothetical protein